MESRKMVLINLSARQQWKWRHRVQTWGHRGERRGWHGLRKQHWNLYITICKVGFPCGWASLVAQLVKNLSAMQETWDRSLGWEDALEKGKATHSSRILDTYHSQLTMSPTILMPLVVFSCIITLVQCWTVLGQWHPCPVSDLNRKAFNISLLNNI